MGEARLTAIQEDLDEKDSLDFEHLARYRDTGGAPLEPELGRELASERLVAGPCAMGPGRSQPTTHRDRNQGLVHFVLGGSAVGCTLCMEAKILLLAERATGVHLSEEWMNGDISSKSQNNLQRKIYKHQDSLANKRAAEISEMRGKDVLPNKVLAVNSHLMQETTTSLSSAYMVAKERMAYRKLPAVMSLQKLNGAKMGNVHKSDHACAEITGHITSEIRAKFVSKVKILGSRISIIIDESTVHGLAYLIIYM
ncbi:uncharacterized protein LOC144467289 [Epinephelus lanceolatus]